MVSVAGPERLDLLAERRDQALRDLIELDAQVEAGEIPSDRAAELRLRYEAEAAQALERLAALERDRADLATATAAGRGEAAEPSVDDAATGGTATGRRRRLAGAALGVAVAAGIAVTAGGELVDRPDGGFVTGNVAEGGRDLSQVTNAEMEEVVAANPDVVPMRLRLAHRYLDDGDNDRAVDHYLAVLDRQADPEAMSHLGWILFLDGELELAARLLEASYASAPEQAETVWFLANLRLYGQQDPDAAVPLLERLLARDDLGSQREDVEQALADAERMRQSSPAERTDLDDGDAPATEEDADDR